MFPARRAGLSPLTSRVPGNSRLWSYCLARGLHRRIFRHDAVLYRTDHTVLCIPVKFSSQIPDFPIYSDGTKPGTLQSISQHHVNLRSIVEWLTLLRLASAVSEIVVVQCSMKSAKILALVTSGRRLMLDAPQALHRHRVVPLLVVPLRFMSPPQWQRGRFFGIKPPHHQGLPHPGRNTGGTVKDSDIRS